TLFATTLLYVAIAREGWGFWPFMWVSVFLGLGYTFYTGAVDAWLVDALKATGYTGPLESVFARGQMVFGAAMLLGTLSGGALGQMNLALPLSRVVRTRTAVLMGSIVVQAIAIVLCGLLRDFYLVVGLYLVYGVALGVAMPVKAGYLNAHIPSEQRATILSLDSFFANLGGVAGQTGWGWLAKRRSIAEAWVASGATLVLGVPLYWIARRADGRLDRFEATSP